MFEAQARRRAGSKILHCKTSGVASVSVVFFAYCDFIQAIAISFASTKIAPLSPRETRRSCRKHTVTSHFHPATSLSLTNGIPCSCLFCKTWKNLCNYYISRNTHELHIDALFMPCRTQHKQPNSASRCSVWSSMPHKQYYSRHQGRWSGAMTLLLCCQELQCPGLACSEGIWISIVLCF